jgi:hypothetical protein
MKGKGGRWLKPLQGKSKKVKVKSEEKKRTTKPSGSTSSCASGRSVQLSAISKKSEE